MLFANIDLLDENLDHRSGQWVGVRDGRIVEVGHGLTMAKIAGAISEAVAAGGRGGRGVRRGV